MSLDYAAIASAIGTRLQAVTPPTGEPAIKVATATALGPAVNLPALFIFPPDEDLEWLPARQVRSSQTWEAELYLSAAGDLPTRMARVYAWRNAIVLQLAGQIQLGLTGIEGAYLRRLAAPELENDDRVLDGLALTIEVVYRAPVSTLSA